MAHIATRTAVVCLGVSLLACVGGDDATDSEPTSSESDVDDGCPDGLSATTDVELTVLGLEVNYLSYNVTFDPTTTYDGVPAACIDDDATELRLMVEVDPGEAFAVLVVEADDTGTFDAQTDEDDASFRFRAIDVEDGPFQWVDGSDSISTGTWVVSEVGTSLDVSLAVTAADAESQLNLQVEVVGSP